ncbi:histidine kinase [Paenibacillus sp. FSL W8-1187]|uniref:sensor histidine kinase n=1 Tax=Paenibacillus sp. FSL W8-1187 TaxID=2975339 RepID=UPI0030DBC3D2
MQIKQKIIYSFLAFIVVPFLFVGWLSSSKAYDMTKDQVSLTLYRLAKQNGMTIERTLGSMNEKTLKFIDEYFTEDAKSPIDLRAISDLSKYSAVSDLISRYSLEGTPYVLYAEAMAGQQDMLPYATGKSGLIFRSSGELPPYYEEAAELKGRGVIRYVPFGDSSPTICFVRAIMDPGIPQQVLGVLYVTNLELLLYSDIWTSQIPEGSGVFLLNDRSEILASMPDRGRGEKLELPAAIDRPESSYRLLDWRGGEELFTHIYLPRFDTRLVYEVPVKSMIGQQQSYQSVLLLVMAACFVLVAGYLIYLVSLMLGPLNKLARMSEKYEPGMTFSFGPTLRRSDEIGKVYASFERMTERVNQMVKERYMLEMKQQEMELMTLHTQITPHLLYNTLDSIYWMAIDKDKPELARMVKDLSSLLRIGLSRGRELVPVREELQHIQAYVRLQLERYNHVFAVHWDVAEEMLETVVPKVILQPIVENAILHGVGKMDGEGEVWVRILPSGSELLLVVEDNGFKAADPDKMNRLMSRSDGEGYGVRNVDRRIKLHFGNRYGIRYSARPEGGTRAELRMPLLREEQAEEQKQNQRIHDGNDRKGTKG